MTYLTKIPFLTFLLAIILLGTKFALALVTIETPPLDYIFAMAVLLSEVPDCIYWSTEEVAEWIEQIGYKQYKVRLVSLLLTGKSDFGMLHRNETIKMQNGNCLSASERATSFNRKCWKISILYTYVSCTEIYGAKWACAQWLSLTTRTCSSLAWVGEHWRPEVEDYIMHGRADHFHVYWLIFLCEYSNWVAIVAMTMLQEEVFCLLVGSSCNAAADFSINKGKLSTYTLTELLLFLSIYICAVP